MTERDFPPTHTLAAHLVPLLRAFADGQESLRLAREIEGAIATRLPDGHSLHELADMFAQYNPGGECLYGRAELLPHVLRWLRLLEQGGTCDS